jgi:methionyl-tRNA formyltransferase
MRMVIFAYWGDIGIRCFEWLMEQGEEVIAVVTRPGEPGEAVKAAVFKHYVPVYQPPGNVNESRFIEILRRLSPDLFFSTYFGRLFSPELLAVPRLGCINMHNSLLPKYRGQAPSTWGIINGDTVGGQTIHWLDEGIDSGDIIAQKSIPIEPDDTGSTLGRKLVDLGVELFKETYPLIKAGEAPRIPQNDEEATYCVSARPRHARIDWTKSAGEIRNLVRAFSRPPQGAYTYLRGERLYVYWCQLVEEPLPFVGQLPGQLLAVTGGGILTRTGSGQLLITDASWGEMRAAEAASGAGWPLGLPATPCVLGDR